MEKYYCTETINPNAVKRTFDFLVTASTLTSAKIQLRQGQVFKGSCLNIFQDKNMDKRLAHSDFGQMWINE